MEGNKIGGRGEEGKMGKGGGGSGDDAAEKQKQSEIKVESIALPELEGTEKQISWAEDIRRRTKNNVDKTADDYLNKDRHTNEYMKAYEKVTDTVNESHDTPHMSLWDAEPGYKQYSESLKEKYIADAKQQWKAAGGVKGELKKYKDPALKKYKEQMVRECKQIEAENLRTQKSAKWWIDNRRYR